MIMKETLIQQLHQFLKDNNPEVLIELEATGKLDEFLQQKINAVSEYIQLLQSQHKPDYIIEALCLRELTKELRPSKFNYIKNILEEEFPGEYSRLASSDILSYEVINLVSHCEEVFTLIDFTEDNEDDKHLRYTITGAIADYFEQYK